MPELPEVETICRTLRDGRPANDPRGGCPALVGRTITGSRLLWPRTLATPSARRFHLGIRGARVSAVRRRGKHIIIDSTRGTLLIHLRMSGSLVLEPRSAAPSRYARLLLDLDNGWRLAFRNPRKFGRAWWVADAEIRLAALGPEPLDPRLDAAAFRRRLRSHRRQLKPLLLDQSFLAGLGNIYVDESLHRARLHPLRRSDQMTAAQARRLWEVIRRVLREAIRYNGTSFDSVYGGGEFRARLKVYGRAGYPTYWVVTTDAIHEHTQPSAAGYGLIAVHRRGDAVRVPYADLEIAVDDVLGPADSGEPPTSER